MGLSVAANSSGLAVSGWEEQINGCARKEPGADGDAPSGRLYACASAYNLAAEEVRDDDCD